MHDSFGSLLAKYRQRRGLSQRDLASEMATAGRPLHRAQISHLEAGGRLPNPEDYQLLAALLRTLSVPEDSRAAFLQAAGASDQKIRVRFEDLELLVASLLSEDVTANADETAA